MEAVLPVDLTIGYAITYIRMSSCIIAGKLEIRYANRELTDLSRVQEGCHVPAFHRWGQDRDHSVSFCVFPSCDLDLSQSTLPVLPELRKQVV